MNSVLAAWRHVPVPIRAVGAGLAVASVGSFPWAWLAQANLRHVRAVPWGAAVMAVYLWLYWRFFTGRSWPASTAAVRREQSRARPLSASVWAAAILAGILGLVASVLLARLIGRLVVMPHEHVGDISHIPAGTLFATAAMGALVAGVVEEIAFRGYMQRPIERRLGPVTAILVVGVIFGLAHGTHGEWSLVLMPYYMAIAATYGVLAWLTDSIFPSLALHAGGDLLGALQLLSGGGSAAAPSGGGATAGVSGVNGRFWINLVVLAAIVTAAVWAYRMLAAAVREEAATAMIPAAQEK